MDYVLTDVYIESYRYKHMVRCHLIWPHYISFSSRRKIQHFQKSTFMLLYNYCKNSFLPRIYQYDLILFGITKILAYES